MTMLSDSVRRLIVPQRIDPYDVVPDLFEDIAVRSAQAVYDKGHFEGLAFDLGIRQTEGRPVEPQSKFVKLLRITRIPPIAIQRTNESKALVDLHRDVLYGLRTGTTMPVTIVANDPFRHGLMFLIGAQALGPTRRSAQETAEQDLEILRGLMRANYRQVGLQEVDEEVAHWLIQRMGAWNHTAIFRGIPQPRREASNALALPLAGVTMESVIEEQIEAFCRGMANREYILVTLAAPLSETAIISIWNKVSRRLEVVESDIERSRTFSGGVSLPFGFLGNFGGSQGVSHASGLTDGTSTGHTDTSSVGTSVGQTTSHGETLGTSTSHSESLSLGATESQGTTLSASHGASQQVSLTHGASVGETHSETVGQSLGQTRGESQSQSLSHQASDSYSVSAGHTQGYGANTSTSDTTSLSQSHSAGESASAGVTKSASDTASKGATGNSGTTSSSTETGGINASPFDIGASSSHATSHGASAGASLSETHGASAGVSSTSSLSESQQAQAGLTHGTTQGSGQSWNESSSLSTTRGVTEGTTTGQTQGSSEGVTSGASDSLSAGTSAGRSISAGESTGLSASVASGGSSQTGQSAGMTQGATEGASASASVSQAQSLSHSSGQSVGETQGASTSESQSAADTLGTSYGWGGSMGIAPMMSVSYQKKLFDEVARNLAGILSTQRNRFTLARQEGAWQTHMYLLAPDEVTKEVGASSAVASFWGPASKGDLPTKFHALLGMEPQEERHLLDHVRTLSGCRVIEPSELTPEIFHYSTVLTTSELAVLVHPPRVDLPGIQCMYEPIPPFRVPVDAAGRLHLGHLVWGEDGEAKEQRFGFDPETIAHTMIVGATRSGKTVGAEQLLVNWVNQPPARVVVHERDGSLAETEVPYGAFVLDWKRTWRAVYHHVQPASRFGFVSLWDPEMGFKYNPLRVPSGVPFAMHRDRFAETIALAFSLGLRGKGIIREALGRLYSARMPVHWVRPGTDPLQVATVAEVPELSRFVGMTDLYQEVVRMAEDAGKDSRGGASRRDGIEVVRNRLQYWAPGEPLARIYVADVAEEELERDPVKRERCNAGELCVEGAVHLEELFSGHKVVCAEGGPLDPTAKKGIITSLASAIFTWAQCRGDHAFSPPIMVVLEEAHEVLVGGQSSDAEIAGQAETIWEIMWNEGASYGLRMMAIGQIPEAFPEAVVANSGSLVLHRVETEKGQTQMMTKLGLDPRVDHRAQKRFIGRLPVGMAVVRRPPSRNYLDADPMLVAVDMLAHDAPDDATLKPYVVRHRR